MARDKSPAQKLFDEVVKRSVVSVLKPLGFRKSATSFHRRHQDVVQVVNLQSGHGSTWDEKLFYINVGLAFDAICRLTDTEILEKPKEYDCDSRGTRDRLEKLIAGAPARWSLKDQEDAERTGQQLHHLMEQLAIDLQMLDCVQAYREHRWFDRHGPTRENAQMHYLLGDLEAAWREVGDLCAKFSDREGLNTPAWWVTDLGLAKLAPRTNA